MNQFKILMKAFFFNLFNKFFFHDNFFIKNLSMKIKLDFYWNYCLLVKAEICLRPNILKFLRLNNKKIHLYILFMKNFI
jgi:hypothetical protein